MRRSSNRIDPLNDSHDAVLRRLKQAYGNGNVDTNPQFLRSRRENVKSPPPTTPPRSIQAEPRHSASRTSVGSPPPLASWDPSLGRRLRRNTAVAASTSMENPTPLRTGITTSSRRLSRDESKSIKWADFRDIPKPSSEERSDGEDSENSTSSLVEELKKDLQRYKESWRTACDRVWVLEEQITELQEERARDRATIDSLTVDHLSDRVAMFDHVNQRAWEAAGPPHSEDADSTRFARSRSRQRRASLNGTLELSRATSPVSRRSSIASDSYTLPIAAQQRAGQLRKERVAREQVLRDAAVSDTMEKMSHATMQARNETRLLKSVYEDKINQLQSALQQAQLQNRELRVRFEKAIHRSSSTW